MVFGCIKMFISIKIGRVLNNSEPKIVNYEFFGYERWFFVTTSKIWSTFWNWFTTLKQSSTDFVNPYPIYTWIQENDGWCRRKLGRPSREHKIKGMN